MLVGISRRDVDVFSSPSYIYPQDEEYKTFETFNNLFVFLFFVVVSKLCGLSSAFANTFCSSVLNLAHGVPWRRRRMLLVFRSVTLLFTLFTRVTRVCVCECVPFLKFWWFFSRSSSSSYFVFGACE